MGLRDLLGKIPVVGDVLAGVDAVAGFISDDKEDAIGLIRKGAKAVSSRSSKERESFRIKPPESPRGQSLTTGRISFSDRDRNVKIPGMSNPYIQQLYRFYDLNQIAKRDLITAKADLSTPSPGTPSGPRKRVS